MKTLTSIHIYPVKSCGGIHLDRAVVEKHGLQHDRRWMIVNDQGTFLTQRTHPRLALIRTRIEAERLTLAAEGQGEISIPLNLSGGPTRVTVWRDTCTAEDQGPAVADWLSTFLGESGRLVKTGKNYSRPVDPAFGKPGDEVSFADAYPLLLLSEASLENLNGKLESPVPMNRFRPNLVVSGLEAHEEDRWNSFRIGQVNFVGVKPSSRCVTTTTDQETAERGPEPLRTLATYRRNDEGEVIFGQNVIGKNTGAIEVGQKVSPGFSG